ncbi:hypothetical protein JYU34_012266 [Plutella xylostella]|uniref:Gustatory receptor n=1 Tax=Plutella xylostella TaxID=51655 RepID=A0ABQ7QFH4_PLUXY|nr:hypothetical protein JYU34_012266 [Plutella xylostella]
MGIDPVKEGAAAVPRARSVEKGTCVVDGAHAFILRISSLFGLAPLRFESRPGGFSVALSAPMCVYSYILVTVLVICTVLGLVAEINVGTSVSVRMSSRMSQLDVSLGAQYSSVSERKLCAVLLSVLFLFSVLIVDDFCFYARQASRFDRTWDVVTNYIGFYLLWFVVVILELQFAFTALSVRARFRAVNDALAHTASCVAVPLEKVKEAHHMNMFAIRVAPADSTRPTNVSLLVDSMSPQDHTVIIRNAVSGEPRLAVPPCEAVRRLGALHGSLCEVIQRVDCSYALPLVVILISTLLHLIVTPYFLIMEISE